ncbi:Proteasome subunit [Trichinella spiralis]|uniref:Proteasome subunit n=1 Tax=Trichinella spiralis TaxID=6334 RepID=A0ABR3KAC2_TRISP
MPRNPLALRIPAGFRSSQFRRHSGLGFNSTGTFNVVNMFTEITADILEATGLLWMWSTTSVAMSRRLCKQCYFICTFLNTYFDNALIVCTAAPLIVRIYEEGFDTVEVTSVSRESVGDYESHYEDRDYQRSAKYPKLVKEFDISEKVAARRAAAAQQQ